MKASYSKLDNTVGETDFIYPQIKQNLFNSSESTENQLAEDEKDVVLDPWRWYVVTVYSLFALLQGLTWATPGALQSTMMKVHGLSNNQIQFLINYGPLSWFVVCVPLSWIIDKYGSRPPVLFSIWCVFIASVVRMFARDASTTSLVLLHVSFFLNGLGGPIAMSACSKISEDWFPPSMRSTATAVMNQANSSNGLVLYLLVPLFVSIEDEAHLHRFNAFCLGFAALTLCMAHLHFPNTPPVPPSPSAQDIKAHASDLTAAALWHSTVDLFCNYNFCLLLCMYSMLNGFSSIFAVTLPAQVKHIGIDQSNAAFIGLGSNAGLVVLTLLIARFSDPRHQRRNTVKLLVITLLSGVAFAGLIMQWFTFGASIPLTSWQGLAIIAILYSGGCMAGCAAVPLIFELCVEYSFGIAPEGTSLMIINTGSNFIAAVSLFIPIDSLGVVWIPWTLAGIMVFCIACTVLLQDKQPRLDFDHNHAFHPDSHHHQYPQAHFSSTSTSVPLASDENLLNLNSGGAALA